MVLKFTVNRDICSSKVDSHLTFFFFQTKETEGRNDIRSEQPSMTLNLGFFTLETASLLAASRIEPLSKRYALTKSREKLLHDAAQIFAELLMFEKP